MANTPKRARHARAQREITDPPQQPWDEPGRVTADAVDLALEPEDLGCHFLSEAMAQGHPIEHAAVENELSLRDEADREVLAELDAELTAWGRLLAHAVGDDRASRQLKAAASHGAHGLEATRARRRERPDNSEVRLIDTTIREASLLDREGTELDQFWSPSIVTDDCGRHARSPGHAQPITSTGPAGTRLRTATTKLRELTAQLRRSGR